MNTINPFEIGVNAKVALITPEFEIVTLWRALDDVDRPGELDLPGGGFDLLPNGDLEQPIAAAARETGEETGLVLGISPLVGILRPMAMVTKLKRDGVFKITHVFVAPTIATVEDIVLPKTEEMGKPEHTGVLSMPVEEFMALPKSLIPRKYPEAIRNNIDLVDIIVAEARVMRTARVVSGLTETTSRERIAA